MSIFNPVTGVKQGVLTTSNTITANFGPATPVSITIGGDLWKNGINVGKSTTVNDGDTLYITVQSSSTYLSAVHTTILIGTTYYTFTVVTKQAPDSIVYQPFDDILPLELPNQQDGSPWLHGEVEDASVLLQFNEPLNSTTIKDSSTHNRTITTYGNFYTTSRDGLNVGNFVGGYVDMSPAVGRLGTNDFRLEVMVYHSGGRSNYPTIFSNYASFTGGGGSLALFAGHTSADTTKYQVALNGTFPAIQSTASIRIAVWTKLAIVRAGTKVTLYVDDVAQGTATLPANTPLDGNANVSVLGRSGDASPSESAWYGLMENFTIATRSQTTNSIGVMDSGGVVTSTIDIPTASAPIASSNDYTIVTNHFADTLTFIDTTTKQVIQTVALAPGSRPHSVAYTFVSETDRRSMAWVTLTGSNQVVLIGPDRSLLGTFPTGSKPMGVSASYTGRYVYVANHGSGTVTQFKWVSSTASWAMQSFPVAPKPFELVVDLTGKAWVTCVGATKLYRVGTDGAIYEVAGVSSPRGICMNADGTNIYVASGGSSFITKYSAITGKVLITRYLTNQKAMPFAICCTADETVYVTSFVTKEVTKYNGSSMSVLATYDTGAKGYPYGITAVSNNEIWVANYYEDTPHYLIPTDQTPDTFAFVPPPELERGRVYSTNEITVSGLGAATPASIPAIYSAIMVVNNSSQTGITSVRNGDRIYINYWSPDKSNQSFELPLFIGNVSASLIGKTRKASSTPTPVTFDVITVGAPITNQESSTATIGGLEGGTSRITLSDTANWHFRLNGVEVFDKIITVKDGDVFSMVGVANLNLSDTIAVQVIAFNDENEQVVFGTQAIQVPVMNNGMQWVHISAQYIVDEFAKFIGVKNAVLHLAQRPDAVATTTYSGQHTTDIVPSYVASLAAHQELAPGVTAIANYAPTRITTDVAQYLPAVKAHADTTPMPEGMTATHTVLLSPVVRYRKAERSFVSMSTIPEFVRDVNVASISVEAKYEKAVETIWRTVAPVYTKDTSYVGHGILPLFHRATDRHDRFTDVPKYVIDLPISGTKADGPKYVYEGTVVQPTIVPVFNIASPPIIRTIPGNDGDDYVPEARGPIRVAPLNIYVSAGTPNEFRTVTPVFAKEETNSHYAVTMVYERAIQPTLRKADPVQYDKVYFVHNINFDDTYAQQGLYPSYEDAIAAGEAEGYQLVNAKLMPTGGWMWNYSFPLPAEGCEDPEPMPEGIPKPWKWYVHGG